VILLNLNTLALATNKFVALSTWPIYPAPIIRHTMLLNDNPVLPTYQLPLLRELLGVFSGLCCSPSPIKVAGKSKRLSLTSFPKWSTHICPGHGMDTEGNPLPPLKLASPLFFKSIYQMGLVRHSRSLPPPKRRLLHREFYSMASIVNRPVYFI
jgi:hypothetical protein